MEVQEERKYKGAEKMHPPLFVQKIIILEISFNFGQFFLRLYI